MGLQVNRLLSYSHNDLPSVWARKHVKFDLNLEFVDPWPPSHIPYYLLPVIVTSMRSLVIIWEDYVRPVILFGPTPRYLWAVSVAELVTPLLLEAIWSCLESHGLIEIMNTYQFFIRQSCYFVINSLTWWLDLRYDDLCWYQWKSNTLNDLHQFLPLLLLNRRYVELLFIIAIKLPRAPC
jgi:hypothetical protein